MSDQISIPAVYMRGGTSKGLLFNKHYLPKDQSELDKYLLAAMGSPDLRQINGMGGATSVTSKVCIISKSCLLYTSPSPRDISGSRMPSSA